MIWQDDLNDIWLIAFKIAKSFLKWLNSEYRPYNSDSYVRSKYSYLKSLNVTRTSVPFIALNVFALLTGKLFELKYLFPISTTTIYYYKVPFILWSKKSL